MRGYFIFNDFISKSLGSLAEKPIISRANRQFKEIQVLGRHSTLIEDYKTYSNITIPLTILATKEDVWLDENLLNTFNGEGGELKLSWLQGSFKVKYVSKFSIKQERTSYTIDLEFVCEPFRYLEEEIIQITSSKEILIAGNYETEHITTVYGSGDISLLINGEQINFKSVDGYISIDTDKLISYKDNLLTNNKMVGEFIKLKAGINKISWIGTVSKIEIRYRGRFLS